jgi:DNA-binding transcriptional LysR family regulator
MPGIPILHTGNVLTTWTTYVAVCRTGSLSGAAAELGYTQSAVSRQIAALEREVGLRLLDRGARGAVPTPAGEGFLRHARVVVHEAQRAFRAAREPDAPRVLVVGATPSLAAGVIPFAIRELIATHEDLPWALRPGLSVDLAERVAADELDLAVVTDAPPGLSPDPRLISEPIGTDEMGVVVSTDHPLAGHPQVRMEELAEEVWAEDNQGSAALLLQYAARAGFVARVDLDEASLPEALPIFGKLALVAAGHAVALVPSSLGPALRPDVRLLSLADPPRRGISALTRADSHPRAADLAAQVARALREVPRR